MTELSTLATSFLAAEPNGRHRLLSKDSATPLALELGIMIDKLKFQLAEATAMHEQLLASSDADVDRYNQCLNAEREMVTQAEAAREKAETTIAHLIEHHSEYVQGSQALIRAKDIEIELALQGVTLATAAE